MFIEGMSCSICECPMMGDQPLFSTWGVWLPQSDPLWRFCDATLHWKCYATWPHRPAFARSYFDFWVASEPQNPIWHRVYLDDETFVDANPQPLIASTWVVLASTGSRISVRLRDWEAWLQRQGNSRHPLEDDAILAARRTLKIVLPTADAVRDAIDLDRKADLYVRLKAEEREQRIQNREQQKADRAHKDAWRAVLSRIENQSIGCPRCGVIGKDFAHYERSRQHSFFICRACGRSFGPQEVR